MILDKENQLSDEQALTATATSTNVIDLGSRGAGKGEALAVLVTLDAAADDSTGDETYAVAVQTDDNDSFSSATELVSKSIERGAAAGSQVVIPVPHGVERYLRLNYTLGGTSPSVTVTSHLVPQSAIQSWEAHADNIPASW